MLLYVCARFGYEVGGCVGRRSSPDAFRPRASGARRTGAPQVNPNFTRRGLRFLYVVNAVAATAAALVLAVAPGAIPAVVGLAITPAAILLACLLAAAELAIASMCAFALRSSQRMIDVQTVTVLVTFHAASAVAGLMIVAAGASTLILWNDLARAIIIAALLVCARIALH